MHTRVLTLLIGHLLGRVVWVISVDSLRKEQSLCGILQNPARCKIYVLYLLSIAQPLLQAVPYPSPNWALLPLVAIPCLYFITGLYSSLNLTGILESASEVQGVTVLVQAGSGLANRITVD